MSYKFKRASYSTKLSNTLGAKMVPIPVSGSVNLRLANVGPLPAGSSGISSKYQVMVTCLFNLVEKDFFIWYANASPFDPDLQSAVSPTIAQAFDSTARVDGFRGVDPNSAVMRFNPKLASFYKTENYWCGGLKYQWAPNKVPSAILIDQVGNLSPIEYSVSLKTFTTVNPPTCSFSVPNLKPGSPPVPYLEMLQSPFERTQDTAYKQLSGFLKNPAPPVPLPYVFENADIDLADANALGTFLSQVEPRFRSSGCANFIFEVSLPPTLAAGSIVGIDLGSLNLKKYFFGEPSRTVKNTYFSNPAVRMETEKKGCGSPDLTSGFKKMTFNK